MSATKAKMPLSGNALKLIGALSMLCDHTGMLLFPQALWLRMVGRLALPIFAFFIAEGCRYTRNRVRYLCTIALCATVFQVVYFIATGDTLLSIFTSFTLSILLIYLLDAWKNSLLREGTKTWKKLLLGIGFFLSVGGRVRVE